jgi:hypothetical protein
MGSHQGWIIGALSNQILPNYLLIPRIQKLKRVTLAAAREMSDEFCASLTATLLKMTLSNQFPMVIACYNKTKRRWRLGGIIRLTPNGRRDRPAPDVKYWKHPAQHSASRQIWPPMAEMGH